MYHVQTRIRLRSVILLYSVLYYLAVCMEYHGVPWYQLPRAYHSPPHRHPAYYSWTGNGVWAWPGGIYVCTLKSIAYLTLATEYSVHK